MSVLQKVGNIPQERKRNTNTKKITWNETIEFILMDYSLELNGECSPKNARNL